MSARQQRPFWTPEQDAELVELRKRGMSFRKIGARMGRSDSSAERRLVRIRFGSEGIRARARPYAGNCKMKMWWAKAKRSDADFQAAMRGAGYKNFTDTRPCTENPHSYYRLPEALFDF